MKSKRKQFQHKFYKDGRNLQKGKALIIQREQMVAYAQDVINRYELGKKGLHIEEQKLIKDIVLGILETASKGAGVALGPKVGKTGFQ